MSNVLLQVNNLAVRYGAITAVHAASIEVRAGEIVTLIGANGAGKTSILRAISRQIPIARGQIIYAGQNLVHFQAHQLPAIGLCHAPEGRGIFTNLSVAENLRLGALGRHNQQQVRDDLERAFALFPILRARLQQPASTLSGGEQQMLTIARALLQRPKLLLLDEPSLGLAPKVVASIFQTIADIHAQGVSVLLVEQNAAKALALAHRAYVLESGHIVLSGSGRELLNSPEVQRAYLGV